MSTTVSDERDRTVIGLSMLSFAAGSMDGIGFLALGGVFASALSGNTILLALAIGQGHFAVALNVIFSLLGYVAGVSAATVLFAKFGQGSAWTLVFEAVALAAFAALWLAFGTTPQPVVLQGLIVLSSVGMGLQGALGRVVGFPGILTVIFTGTYTTIASNFTTRVLNGERPLVTPIAVRQISALAAYAGGALIVGVMAAHWLRIAPLLSLAAVLAALAGLRLRLVRLERKPPGA